MKSELEARARELFAAGVAAADPARAVDAAMAAVLADGPAPGGRWHLLALGKAAGAMARAALRHLPEGVAALVVTNPENAGPVPGAEVLAGGHPVPDAGSAAAGQAILARLAAAGPGDRVLALISGGGSALAVAPVAGLSLADKAEVSRLLLLSGADITQMNLVRQHLSRLKGGGWLRACGAPISALILSDVPGDDLRVIASGPTVAPIGSRAAAADLCRAFGIWDRLPVAARAHLGAPESAVADPVAARNRLVGANAISLAAMVAAGAEAGPFALEGDVAALAPRLVAQLRDMAPGKALVFGGETVVRVTGDGLGGRNQELALRVALAAEAAGIAGDWLFLSGGTDGRDGPTEAAGGIVGPGSLAAMRRAGVDPQGALARNDSNPALAAGGALLVTGATGTNVADLAVLIRG